VQKGSHNPHPLNPRAPESCGHVSVTRGGQRLVVSICAAGVLFIAAAVAAPAALGQQKQPKNEFGVWGAYSVNSPDVYGSQGHQQFGVAAVRYGRTLFSSRRLAVEYALDVEPVELAREDHYATCQTGSGGIVLIYSCVQGKQEVYGGGVSPFGWKFNFRTARRWQPFGALSAGFVASRQPIPADIAGATLFNFTFNFQVGVERFNPAHTRAWTFSYALQHISNADRSSVNPGVDLNMITVGYSFFK
jgi:Lipid A 3-O-deacylase (PagL)